MGYSPWGHKGLDTPEGTQVHDTASQPPGPERARLGQSRQGREEQSR